MKEALKLESKENLVLKFAKHKFQIWKNKQKCSTVIVECVELELTRRYT